MCSRISPSAASDHFRLTPWCEKSKTLIPKLVPKGETPVLSDFFLTINSESFSVQHTGPLFSVRSAEKHERFACVFYANDNISLICERVTMGMGPTTIGLSWNQANVHLKSMGEHGQFSNEGKKAFKASGA